MIFEASAAPQRSTTLLRRPKPRDVVTSIAIVTASSVTSTETEVVVSRGGEGEEDSPPANAAASAEAASSAALLARQIWTTASAPASAEGRMSRSNRRRTAARENAGNTALRISLHSVEKLERVSRLRAPRALVMRSMPCWCFVNFSSSAAPEAESTAAAAAESVTTT